MKMIYGVNDKPPFAQLIVFAIQQLLAIMAATLVVPVIVGNEMSPAAALFGAGIGTLVYLAFRQLVCFYRLDVHGVCRGSVNERWLCGLDYRCFFCRVGLCSDSNCR